MDLLLSAVAALLLPYTPWQAYAAALAALGHCPSNAKAWLRTAEACKAAKRWQLAQLCYSMAVEELGVTDEAAKVRRQMSAAAAAGAAACMLVVKAGSSQGCSIRSCLGTQLQEQHALISGSLLQHRVVHVLHSHGDAQFAYIESALHTS